MVWRWLWSVVTMSDVLKKIMIARRQLVMQGKQQCSLDEMRSRALQSPVPRSFVSSLQKSMRHRGFAIIAEIKKASPSAGQFATNHDTMQIAHQYEQAGAAALSVLTEEQWFGGSLDDLSAAKKNSSLPILRKDFIMDEWQLYESRACGADAILLIMAALSPQESATLAAVARRLHLTVLAEAHDEEELRQALSIEDALIGINSRNLRDLTIDHEEALRLHTCLPANRLAVAESGIKDARTFLRYREASVSMFLMGEQLMRAPHPGNALKKWMTM